MGTQLPKRGTAAPSHFSAHVYCGQTAGWIEMPLGMEVGLAPLDIVLDGDPVLTYPERGAAAPSTFRPMSIVAKRHDGSGCLRWTQLPPESNGRASHLLPSSCCTAHRKVSSYVTMRRYVSPAPKIAPSPFGDRVPPCHTWCLRPNRVIAPNGISIGSAVSVWLPNAILYNALSLGKKTPKITPSPWDFITLPEEDRATAVDSIDEELIKIARVVPQLSSRTYRQTHRQTDRHTYKRIHRNTSPPFRRSHGRSKNHNLKGLAVGKLS